MKKIFLLTVILLSIPSWALGTETSKVNNGINSESKNPYDCIQSMVK